MKNINREHILCSHHTNFANKIILTVNMLDIKKLENLKKTSICNFITHYHYLYRGVQN